MQIQKELEAVQLAIKGSEDFKFVTNKVKEVFEPEIKLLAETIPLWWERRRLSNGELVKPSPTEIYRSLLAEIDGEVLAESILRAIFESTLSNDTLSTDYQQVVDKNLIVKRFRSLIGKEREGLIEKKHKFRPVDELVNNTVRLFLGKLFYESRQEHLNRSNGRKEIFYTISLTEDALKRLGEIPKYTIVIDSPMFCKPEPWTSVFSGGFLTPEAQRGNPLIQSHRLNSNDLREIDKSLQASSEILPAINKMQSVAFRLDPNFQNYQNTIKSVRKDKIAKCDQHITRLTGEIRELYSELNKLLAEAEQKTNSEL